MNEELKNEIARNVQAALAEDVGSGDWTAQLLPESQQATAKILCRVPAVVCGQPWAERTLLTLDPGMRINWLVAEGAAVAAGDTICELHGRTRALLTAERTVLNFLQMLSAVATATRRYVDAVRGTRAKILDTRKTLPGLRLAEKYAVTMGGGVNHRKGLYDGILIKENHIAAAGSVSAALRRAQELAPPGVWIQIEVENHAQLEEALAAGAKLILLDNMTPAQMAQAVKLTAGRAELEASGGITLETVREIAQTGVDRISIGSLTKDIDAVDLSMRLHRQ
ncbi:MAG: carboxylating nicotinate-nucleotide diphosphorylase [Rhodospirillaceae bacterium]